MLLLGCARPAPEPPADRSAYLQAVRSGATACDDIGDASLAGECHTFAAQQRAATDLPGALALCTSVAHPVWRDECVFLACDTAEVDVAAARACCADAGRFVTRCTGHAVSREVYAVLEAAPRGTEDAAWQAAQQASIAALGPGGAERAADLFVRFLVDRSSGDHLAAEDCGTAPTHACTDAYAELVARVARERGEPPPAFVRRACARVVSVERATSLGLPGWDPALDPAVQAAFARMCAR